MTSLSLLLYDEDRDELRHSIILLNHNGIERRDVTIFGNRLTLFKHIMGACDRCVALIDLQADDRSDYTYSGHRVIETIARHPELSARCAPAAFTAHSRPDVVELARRHRAIALLSKNDLDRHLPVGGESFPKFITRLREGPTAGFEIFPATVAPPAVTASLDVLSAFVNVHVEEVVIARKPYFWHVMRYLADDVDKASIGRWIEAEFDGARRRTVINQIGELGNQMLPRYRRRSLPALTDFAQDVLELAPQQRVAPSDTEMLRLLPYFSVGDEVLGDRSLRKISFIDAEAAEALDRVVSRFPALGKREGRDGIWRHTEDIEAALRLVEPDSTKRIPFRLAFIRGVNGMYDTDMARCSP
jgi:hypothetical protein